MNKEQILDLIAANRGDEAAQLLETAFAQAPDDNARAEIKYLSGRLAWKTGRRAEAMGFYAEAVALNPDSEAAVALEQALAIMNFYNKDLYNP